jgi:hyperpolarization activated cyclic nucleotide-gated potassium channel 2
MFTLYTVHVATGAAVIVLNRREIAHRYLRGWFAVDLISSIPLDYIIVAAFNASYDDASFLRASRAIKFLRITKLLSLLRLLRVTRVIGLFRRWEDVLNINSAWFRMAKLLGLMLLLAHWSGCVQFLAVQLANYPPDSWVVQLGIHNQSVAVQYSWSLFQALSHMLCIGYGRYPPQNATEVWLTIFSMVIGATFYAIFIGQMSSMMLSIDAASRSYSEKVGMFACLPRGAVPHSAWVLAL